MLDYVVRRVAYAIPILIGVNLITFALFFVVNTPDDMARIQLGAKRVTPEAIEKWKAERGYDKPLLYNAQAEGVKRFTDTIFYEKSARLFAFDFGRSDDGRDIGREIRNRMGPSLAIAVPVFLIGLVAYLTFSLILAFFRATYVDFSGVVAVRGPHVHLRDVLHHRRAVRREQAVAAGADLRLRRGPRCREVSRPAGAGRARREPGRAHALVPDHLPRGDEQGLRPHGPRQGPIRDAGALHATCSAMR